jgi:hypothetical protein
MRTVTIAQYSAGRSIGKPPLCDRNRKTSKFKCIILCINYLSARIIHGINFLSLSFLTDHMSSQETVKLLPWIFARVLELDNRHNDFYLLSILVVCSWNWHKIFIVIYKIKHWEFMMLMHHSLLIHLCVLNYFTITTPFRMTITFYNILIADPIRSPESPSVETSNLFYRLGNEIILAALSLLCVVKGTCYVQ